MSGSLIRSSQAERDLSDIADYLGRQSATLAIRFLDAAADTFTQVVAQPGLGGVFESRNRRLAGLRVLSISGYPSHLVFYRQRGEDVEIVRVLYGARDLDNLP
jgi:toxin ParE1/3/4